MRKIKARVVPRKTRRQYEQTPLPTFMVNPNKAVDVADSAGGCGGCRRTLGSADSP